MQRASLITPLIRTLTYLSPCKLLISAIVALDREQVATIMYPLHVTLVGKVKNTLGPQIEHLNRPTT